MKVLVTGGAGRLGRSVVSELIGLGHDVVSVDRAEFTGTLARHIVLDLTDEAATTMVVGTERPDAIIHLAGIAVPFSAPESVILRTNTALITSVMHAVVAARVPRVLAASSPTVIGYGSPTGWAPDYLPIDERHSSRPWNAYALSKLVIEETIATFARSTPGAVFGAFRPGYVIAPEEWAGAPTQQGHTVLERLAEPGLAAASLFNYVDARDVGAFIDIWLTRASPELSGEVFFVAAADSLLRKDLPTALTHFHPSTEGSARVLGRTDPVFATTKAELLLGWRPTRTWRSELAATTEPQESPS